MLEPTEPSPEFTLSVCLGATSASRRVVSHRPQSADSGRSRDDVLTVRFDRLQTFLPHLGTGPFDPKPSRLLRLTKAAFSVSVGGRLKQEKRSRESGRDRQVEAVSKRRKADQFRRTCRTAVSRQSRLRSRRWPRPAMLGLLGKRCCALYRSRAKRRALPPQVQQGVPVPRRQATPLVRIEDNRCESWPRPS